MTDIQLSEFAVRSITIICVRNKIELPLDEIFSEAYKRIRYEGMSISTEDQVLINTLELREGERYVIKAEGEDYFYFTQNPECLINNTSTTDSYVLILINKSADKVI